MTTRFGPAVRRSVLLLLLATIACGHMLRFRVVVDDAFITLRVARQWIEHGLPEYNLGIREWVPTSFLWVALLAVTGKVVPVSLPLLAQVLGALAGLATLALLALGFPGLGAAGPWAALLCAGSAMWAAWPLSGMETSMFSLALLAGVLCLMRSIEEAAPRRAWIAGLACGTAALLRPEGLLLFAAGLATLAVTTRDLPRLGRCSAGFALAVLPGAAYLWGSFGTLRPVSSYAKLNGLANLGHGLAYLADAARSGHLAYVAPLALLPLLARPTRRAGALLLGIVGVWACTIALEGGDFMAYYRFVAPVWPVWTLAVGLGLAALARRLETGPPGRARLAGTGVALLALAVAAAWAAPSWRGPERIAYERSARDELAREAIGTWLAGRYPDSDWVAVKPAGIIPYYSRMRAVDFFCITDLEAARTGHWVPDAWPGHQRTNPRRIHDLAPRLAILEARLYPLESLPPPTMTDPNHGAAWLADPRASRYEPVRAEVLPGLWLDLFVRDRE